MFQRHILSYRVGAVQPDVHGWYVLSVVYGVSAVCGGHVHYRRHCPELQSVCAGDVRELNWTVRLLGVSCGQVQSQLRRIVTIIILMCQLRCRDILDGGCRQLCVLPWRHILNVGLHHVYALPRGCILWAVLVEVHVLSDRIVRTGRVVLLAMSGGQFLVSRGVIGVHHLPRWSVLRPRGGELHILHCIFLVSVKCVPVVSSTEFNSLQSYSFYSIYYGMYI